MVGKAFRHLHLGTVDGKTVRILAMSMAMLVEILMLVVMGKHAYPSQATHLDAGNPLESVATTPRRKRRWGNTVNGRTQR